MNLGLGQDVTLNRTKEFAVPGCLVTNMCYGKFSVSDCYWDIFHLLVNIRYPYSVHVDVTRGSVMCERIASGRHALPVTIQPAFL